MSYTLRGRIDSRLAASLPVLVLACVLAAVVREWWPVELALLMLGTGLALDVLVYDRVLAYQPGWLALPLGAVELGVLVAAARAIGLHAPLWPSLGLFGAGWLSAQLLGHAGLPLLRLSYAEDGGELGRAGVLTAAGVGAVVLGAGSVAWANQPPVVHLAAGVHQGPIVITRREVLDGEPGTVVRGGIVVRADGVTVRDLHVIGGENGIDVELADDVVIEDVTVTGAELDGIHARMSSVHIRDCTVDMTGRPFGQGIDLSFAAHRDPSAIEGCTVIGGQEGIVTHSLTAHIMDNRVSRTTLRAISMTEMSMGMISDNEVRDAQGVGILCNDSSMCMIEDNVVVGTRPERGSDDLWRQGHGILVSYEAEAELKDNELAANPHAATAVAGGEIDPR